MFKMVWRMARALGFKNFSDIIKKFQAGGDSLEKTYRDGKKWFVQIELLAVKKEYQGQGFMRPLVNTRTLGEKSFMYDLVRENKA